MAKFPDWALAQKRPGTELRCIRGKYYLYECSSFYDKEKKKTRKKTGAYLGMVTEGEGLVPPRRRQVKIENVKAEAKADNVEPPQPKIGKIVEYGLSEFITSQCTELIDNLEETFPFAWSRVLSMAYCRLCDQSPLRCMEDDFADSYLSQSLGTEGLSAESLEDLLKHLGRNRNVLLAFMRKYAHGGGNVLFDGTGVLSSSPMIDFLRMSMTKPSGLDNAVNLMMGFSTQQMLPVYYRILPSEEKDITFLITSIYEMGDKSVTVIGDKDFYSKANVEALEEHGISYIIALRRSMSGLDYSVFGKRKSEGRFIYAGRRIKYSRQAMDGRTVYLYYDAKRAAEEKKGYLRRVDDEEYEDYTMETYAAKAPQFGTTALMVSADGDAEKVYCDYKSRCEAEQEIDVFKTATDERASFMQDDDCLEGWMFINFIALHIFCMIRRRLVEAGLADKLSTREAIYVLCRHRIVQIDGRWVLAQPLRWDRAQLEALGVPVV